MPENILLLLLLVFIIAAVEIIQPQSTGTFRIKLFKNLSLLQLSFVQHPLHDWNSRQLIPRCFWFNKVKNYTVSFCHIMMLNFSREQIFIFSILRHCLANLRHIASLLSPRDCSSNFFNASS